MTAVLFRAELDGGRTLTYVSGPDDQVDGVPRVYVGSRTSFEDDPAGLVPLARQFTTVPTLSVDELVLSPDGARALAERLLVAAMQVEATCECGHRFWEHSSGRPCCGHEPAGGALCRCGRFVMAITTSRDLS